MFLSADLCSLNLSVDSSGSKTQEHSQLMQGCERIPAAPQDVASFVESNFQDEAYFITISSEPVFIALLIINNLSCLLSF